MSELILSILWFTSLIVILTVIILALRAKLITTGNVTLLVNNDKTILSAMGESLLTTLSQANIFLPSACGGKGTCGQCKVTIIEGGGEALPTETALLSRVQINHHLRLACQLIVKNDLHLQVPVEMLEIKKLQCTVQSNRNVATFIKELVLLLPEDKPLQFKAGAFILLESPAFECEFKHFNIDNEYKTEWDQLNLWRYHLVSEEPTPRAYSMANDPHDNNRIILNVRIALPPIGANSDIPPGIVSSYIFNLKAGDTVSISGPYGEFFARDTSNEMIFIGGGAGMAPLRSHIRDQLLRIKTTRKISFWYGARSLQELFYREEFDQLQAEHSNFEWTVALSDPKQSEQWQGETGLIHKIICNKYLRNHPAPDECEYYLCGPPMMNAAVIKMLEDLGVDKENIMLDDFQG